MPRFLEDSNMIALLVGKLCVVHFLSFDKSCLKRPRLLPQLALLNDFQSCTYDLNPRLQNPAGAVPVFTLIGEISETD